MTSKGRRHYHYGFEFGTNTVHRFTRQASRSRWIVEDDENRVAMYEIHPKWERNHSEEIVTHE